MENNNLPSFTAKDYLLRLTILSTAMLVSQMIFALAIFFTSLPLAEINTDMLFVFWILVPATTLGGIGISFFMFNLKLKEVHNAASLEGKLSAYTIALILRFAFLEAPSFIATIAFMLTGAVYFLAVPILVTGLILAFYPNKKRVVQHLQLSLKEEEFFM